MAKLPLIWVKGTKFNDKKLKNRVVLFERHPDHPNDEAFVSHDGLKYEVAETALVKRLIGEGLLERVNWNSAVPENPKGKKKVPNLRKATNEEEENAKPPIAGSPDEDTAQVPVN